MLRVHSILDVHSIDPFKLAVIDALKLKLKGNDALRPLPHPISLKASGPLRL